MQRQVIINISCLANVRTESYVLRGKELAELPSINDAYLIIENGVIAEYGEMKDLKLETPRLTDSFGQANPKSENQNSLITTHHSLLETENWQTEIIDANNSTILPCWCDSHT